MLNKTGIEGAYDMEFEVSAEEFRLARHARRRDTGGSLRGFVRLVAQKLGLRLESRKSPVEVLVVDKAEKIPTEN